MVVVSRPLCRVRLDVTTNFLQILLPAYHMFEVTALPEVPCPMGQPRAPADGALERSNDGWERATARPPEALPSVLCRGTACRAPTFFGEDDDPVKMVGHNYIGVDPRALEMNRDLLPACFHHGTENGQTDCAFFDRCEEATPMRRADRYEIAPRPGVIEPCQSSGLADLPPHRSPPMASTSNASPDYARCGLRNCPVYEAATSAMCSGVPSATRRPPASPPSGPRSITQSATLTMSG
jgi:hypothetical protein